jgi:ABC-2 type transport system permease protein
MHPCPQPVQEWELEMTSTSGVSSQVTTIAELRWRMFINGLRSRRGKMELVSRILVASTLAVGGVVGFGSAIGMSWFFVSDGKPEFLAIPLWGVFLFWQLFPVMATAFTSNPDSSELLRFPLTYRSFFLVRLAYGYFDPASALGSLGLLGVLVGVTFARPTLFPWTLMVVVAFALFNLVLMQMIFAWIERWLAQRRTREIFGVLFIMFMLSFQLIGPIMGRFTRGPHPELRHDLEIAVRIQSALPPGLAANSIVQASQSHLVPALTSLLLLAAVTIAVGLLLHLRIRAQFHGENLNETAARPRVKQTLPLPLGWELPGFSHSVAAVFEKEIRYLVRSGPMLLTLIMPIFMLLIFRFGAMNALRHSRSFARTPDMAFPGAAAYSLLVLTNLLYNSFGGDGGGMQFFYASPVHFRHVILGKNLTHVGVLLFNAAFAWIAVTWLYGAPHLAVSIATLAGLLFAAPLNFAAGNLLSLYAPKKRDFSTFGRQNVSQTTVLVSFGMQIVIVGIGIGVFALARLYQNLWIATILFLILAAISIPVYVVMLRRLDRIAIDRRETLLAELCRA